MVVKTWLGLLKPLLNQVKTCVKIRKDFNKYSPYADIKILCDNVKFYSNWFRSPKNVLTLIKTQDYVHIVENPSVGVKTHYFNYKTALKLPKMH